MAHKEVLKQVVCPSCIHGETTSTGFLRCLNPDFSQRMRTQKFSRSTNIYDVLKKGGQTQMIDQIDRTGVTCAEIESEDHWQGTIVGGTPRNIWGKIIR